MKAPKMTPQLAAVEIVRLCPLIMATTDACRKQIERFLAYFVDGEGDEPFREEYPDRVLNPKLNGTCELFKRLRDALGFYLPGTLPVCCVAALSEMTRDSLSFVALLEDFARTESLEVSLTVESDIFSYMTKHPSSSISFEKHRAILKDKFKQAKNSFYQNSAFYSKVTTDILNESPMPRKKECKRTLQEVLSKLKSKRARAPRKPARTRRAVSIAQVVELLDARCEKERLGDKKRTAKTFERWERGESTPVAGYSAACRDSLQAIIAWIDGYIVHCRAQVQTERTFVSFDERYCM